MAEDALKIENQAVPRGYSRREAIKKGAAMAGIATLGAIVGVKGVEAVDNIVNPHKPKEIYLGQIEMSLQDINLRDEPRRHNVYYGDYRLSDIRKINGKDYHGEKVLVLENAAIVDGSDPDAPNDEGIGRWIKIRVQSEGLIGGDRDAYVSISSKTSGVMKFIDNGGYKPVQELKDLPPEKINQTNFKQAFSK